MDALCRVCLTCNTDRHYYSLLTIFPEFSDKCLCILDLLTLVTSSEVTFTEKLPNNICMNCFKLLKQAYEFIILYEASQVTLQETFQNVNEKPIRIENATESDLEENIFIVTEESCDSNNIFTDLHTIDEERNEDNRSSDNETEYVECSVSAGCVDDSLKKQTNKGITETREDSISPEKVITGNQSVNNAFNYVCVICNNLYDSLLKLNAHKKQIHNPKWKEKFKCHKCGAQCRTVSGFRYHMRKHDGKKFACEKCDKIYLTKTVLNEHVRRVHENKLGIKFFCEICAKGFKFKNALEYHLHLHTNIRDFICRFCGFRSVTCSALKRHERTHTGERPYNCRHCERTFAGSAERLKHELGHKGIYPHKCQYCQKPFIQMYNMRVHWLQHAGSFKCEMCDKAFIDSEVLNFHYNYFHKIKKL